MTFSDLVDEIRSRSIDELEDIAHLAKIYAREKTREEFRMIGEKNMKEYLEGKLDQPTEDIVQFSHRLQEHDG